jgi:hypothetical protein
MLSKVRRVHTGFNVYDDSTWPIRAIIMGILKTESAKHRKLVVQATAANTRQASQATAQAATSTNGKQT